MAHMKKRSMQLTLALGAVTLVLASLFAQPARAGLDIDFGATVHVGDDTDLYLAVSSRYFNHDQESVRKWNRRCTSPDDLAVALFIARYGKCSPDAVFALRAKGLTWWQIGVRFGVPARVWFVRVHKDPGPPYGNAYGHWKKYGHREPAKMHLSDDDARNLVALRMLHEYYGVSAEVAMEWRASGRDLRTITAAEYRHRHQKRQERRAVKQKHRAKTAADHGEHRGKRGRNPN
jgi:hypothetical protein